jgi:four helix bundle protein
MARVNGFKELIAWQKGMDLVLAVYTVSAAFPGVERFGLTSQVRRAAVSIVSNIAEGYGRRTKQEYLRFLDRGRGSANEVETQLLIASRLRLADKTALDPVLAMVQEEQRILRGLVDSLDRSERTSARG